MFAVMISSSYPYKYKPLSNRVIPLSNGITRKGWKDEEVSRHYADKSLKDVVAEFGLRAPYDVSSEVETRYEDQRIINCDQKSKCDVEKNSNESKYRVASPREHLIITGFSKERQPTNFGLYKKFIDRAYKLKSAFQCFTFNRDHQSKRKSSFDKSSIQNQDLSCEHLEQLKVQVEGSRGEYFITCASREHFTITTWIRKVTLRNQRWERVLELWVIIQQNRSSGNYLLRLFIYISILCCWSWAVSGIWIFKSVSLH